MARILVSGLVNVETTLHVDGFPLPYFPVRYPFFGVRSTVSGVGFNVAKALHTLGNEVHLASLIGQDLAGRLVRETLATLPLPDGLLLGALPETPQSVILVDGAGRRQIHTDLKNIQEQSFPSAPFEQALASADMVVLCNVNFSRPFLQAVRRLGKPVATDVHALSALDDPYNADFMAAAHVLFMSHEQLPVSPEDFARAVLERYGPEILVMGLGAGGALLALRDEGTLERFPAVPLRPVASTIGAGDALFSAFLHTLLRTGDARESLRRALLFAAHKIGALGGAEGFLDHPALEQLYAAWRPRLVM